MEISLLAYAGLFLASLVTVSFLTPQARKFALKRRVFDVPIASHKTHVQPVPYLGGVAIVLTVLLVTYLSTAIFDPTSLDLISFVLIPCLILGVVGLVDDLVELKPWPRFLAQTAVGLVVSAILINTNTVGNPTGSRFIDYLITTLFIVGLSNSINFFDNVDGGASGTVAISSAFLMILSYTSGQYYIAALAIVVSGSTVGFLWWNKSPAKIYMGDAGSLFLGSLTASLLVRFEPNPIVYPTFFFVPLFLIAVPLLDTTTVVISRIMRGVSPFQGGRDHLSHRLMRIGLAKAKAVVALWFLTFAYCLLALALSYAPYTLEYELVIFGSIIWIVLLSVFLRIPATD